MANQGNNIKVVCRFRPPNSIEKREGGDICVNFSDDLTTVKVSGAAQTGPEANGFTFDRVFPMATQQKEVFDYGVKDIVADVLDGTTAPFLRTVRQEAERHSR
ncbi:hypothetical protein BD626DRAFT_49810 [Schizophyllum amplum]|uniref:Kinesin motor domain-containing protein n=1 Tax=Schizophyllum amplum TaxID=97359 RepID=A0A550CCF6_9AGAR|nr:hypothetical protein BD626DRAFT_49810 [Auriculariopsis ampla]